jgi:hypothetical protein
MEEKTAGGASGDLNKNITAIKDAKAMKPTTSHGNIFVFPFCGV